MIGFMDQSYYINIAIALLPFIFWIAILFLLSSPFRMASQANLSPADNKDIVEDIYTENCVIIPYGLIFPIYYRSNSGLQKFG